MKFCANKLSPDARMDGQRENITPPAPNGGRGLANKLLSS